MSSARDALVTTLDNIELTHIEHSCGEECWEGPVPRGSAVVADELLAELERRGWKLVQIDPFAAADPPPGCCGGWVGPSGQRAMCCPVASPGPSDEQLAAALDAFQEAAEANGYDRTEGSAGDARRSRERMNNTRVALVRLIIGERAGSTNAPAIGGADAEPGDLVLTRQGVLDAFAERLTRIEDWIYIQDPSWQGRP